MAFFDIFIISSRIKNSNWLFVDIVEKLLVIIKYIIALNDKNVPKIDK